MVEGTPGQPYGGLLSHFNVVESSMKYRREEVTQLLDKDETVMSITSFPRLGCPQFSNPSYEVTPGDPDSAAQSLFFPDDLIFSGHPRFKNLTRNIRKRRGGKVCINVPIYKDINTKIPVEFSLPETPDHVYMDAMGFGMGCSCLQLTFQVRTLLNIKESKIQINFPGMQYQRSQISLRSVDTTLSDLFGLYGSVAYMPWKLDGY